MADFEIEFASRSVFDSDAYLNYIDDFLMKTYQIEKDWKLRIDDPGFDGIEKIFPITNQDGTLLYELKPASLTVILATGFTDLKLKINLYDIHDLKMKTNQHLVIPSSCCKIEILSSSSSKIHVRSLRESIECLGFLHSPFRLYWPIMETTQFFETIHGQIWLKDVKNMIPVENFDPSFLFTCCQKDSKVFKLLRPHCQYHRITFSPFTKKVKLAKFEQTKSIHENHEQNCNDLMFIVKEFEKNKIVIPLLLNQ